MRNLTYALLILGCVITLQTRATDKKAEYFFPKLYTTLWPDFCLEHLWKYPEVCSEQDMDDSGHMQSVFSQEGSSECQIDRDILSTLSSIKEWIPTQKGSCAFLFCPICRSPVFRKTLTHCDSFDDEDVNWNWDDDEESCTSIVGLRCACMNYWYNDMHREAPDEEANWIQCTQPKLSHAYFDRHHKQFFPFFEQHLAYVQQNPNCLHYWPHRSQIACGISDLVYDQMSEQSYIEELAGLEKPISDFPYFPRSQYGILTGLFTHAFFYTHYRQILLFLAEWSESHLAGEVDRREVFDSIYSLIDAIQLPFLKLYSQCLKEHPHPKIRYERGMILFHQGKMLDSLQDIRELLDSMDPSDPLETSSLYFQEGKAYAELGLYDQAVASLNRAIQKNPQNKEAYFERASAYFELGQFDLSLSDYLASDMRPTPLSTQQMLSFSLGFTKGLLSGGARAGVEFFPSLIGSLQGLGHGLWAFVQKPLHASLEMVRAFEACVDFVKNHTPQETLCKLVPELQDLVGNWYQLNQKQRGKLAGFIIGKYGVDIFAGSYLAKGIKAYQDLKRANNLLTFETMALSERNRTMLKLEAARRVQARNMILEQANLKIHWGRQNKHTKGHTHYQENKSVLMHSDPQRLVRNFAGKGLKGGNRLPGSAGYKEIVNFEEFIGYYIVPETGESTATTWGKIHYALNGVHIVPQKPPGFYP